MVTLLPAEACEGNEQLQLLLPQFNKLLKEQAEKLLQNSPGGQTPAPDQPKDEDPELLGFNLDDDVSLQFLFDATGKVEEGDDPAKKLSDFKRALRVPTSNLARARFADPSARDRDRSPRRREKGDEEQQQQQHS